VEAKHTPKTSCHGPCLRRVCMKDEFTAYEWKNKVDPYCKICEKRMQMEERPHRCNTCRKWRPNEDFAQWMHDRQIKSQYVCHDCKSMTGLRLCSYCEKKKAESQFPKSRWEQGRQKRVCIECAREKTCSGCGRSAGRQTFSHEEWARNDDQRKCKDCVPRRCHQCRKGKKREDFSKMQWSLGDGKGCCKSCEKKRCMKCNKEKGMTAFSHEMWQLPEDSSQVYCKQCTRGDRQDGMWTCFDALCKKQLPKTDFTIAHQRRNAVQLRRPNTVSVIAA